MAWMRHPRTGPDAGACRERQPRGFADLVKRERIKLRNNLAFEPCLVPRLLTMLLRPLPVSPMSFFDRLTARAVHRCTPTWIIADCGLRCEGFASRLDRTQPCSRRALGMHLSQ